MAETVIVPFVAGIGQGTAAVAVAETEMITVSQGFPLLPPPPPSSLLHENRKKTEDNSIEADMIKVFLIKQIEFESFDLKTLN